MPNLETHTVKGFQNIYNEKGNLVFYTVTVRRIHNDFLIK